MGEAVTGVAIGARVIGVGYGAFAEYMVLPAAAVVPVPPGWDDEQASIRRHVFNGLMEESRNVKAKPSERILALIALGKIDVVSMFREMPPDKQVIERDPAIIELELRDRRRALFHSAD